MKKFRIKGNTEIIAASCMKQALCKLVDPDGDFVYRNHWYTKSNNSNRFAKSWAEFETSYGYKGIVEEL